MIEEHEIKCEWDPTHGWWSFCVVCNRPAWGHQNSDVLRDLNHSVDQIRDGETPCHPHTKGVEECTRVT